METNRYFEEIDKAYDGLSGEALEKRLLDLARQAETEYGPESVMYASMCSELGAFYRGQDRLEDSEKYFREALMLLVNTIGRDNPDYATALNNLAGTLRRMGRFEEAEALFSQAMAIYEITLGKKHILYASGLNNLSLVNLDQGKLEAAAELLSQASEILAALPECRDELAAALCNLGSLHRQTGALERSETELRQAVEMFETELGTHSPHYHAALYTLALTRLNACDVAGAKELLRRARTAATALYGPEHRETRVIDSYLRKVEEMR